MKKKGNHVEVLIQWQNRNPEDAVWQELHTLQHLFPDFRWSFIRPCGQVLLIGGDNCNNKF